MNRKALIFSLAVSLVSILLMAALPIQTEQSSNNISVLFILDNSGSMANSDRENLRYSAARLFTSLLNEGDAVGALIFATNTQVITEKIEVIDSQDEKTELANQFMPVPADGYTDAKAAFILAEEMLNKSTDRPDETVIIFLTDGTPEVESQSSNYISETLEEAVSLGIPVRSIALTQGGATSFLTDLATKTGGQVHTANTAVDLLDVFLEILGNLKDRTVLGEGIVNAPTEEEISVDVSVIPYLKQVSFVVSKGKLISTTLIDPDGKIVSLSDPRIKFTRLDDPNFDVFTLENITGGVWRVALEGTGEAQIRTILNASLRVKILSPDVFGEAGTPLLITAHIVEETTGGEINRVIGDASLYAEIITPGGELESLDRLFDDGSHGDEKAGDGIYSREYLNTDDPGTYTIKVLGTKNLVPVQDQNSVTLIPFPELVSVSPEPIRYNLGEGEDITLKVQVVGEDGAELESGMPSAVIIDQDGKSQEITLEEVGNNTFQAKFTPKSSGNFSVAFFVKDGVYKTLPYTHQICVDFSVNIIQKIRVDLEKTNLDLGKVERLSIIKGVPLSLFLSSSVDQPIVLQAYLEGLPDFDLGSTGEITVPANGEAELNLLLKGLSTIGVGVKTGQLVLKTDEEVNLEGAVIPLSIELFDPTITITETDALTWTSPEGCLDWTSHLTIETRSTSTQPETVKVSISGLDNINLVEDEIQINPGVENITLNVTNMGTVSKGEKAITLFFDPEREGVLTPHENEGVMSILNMPSFFNLCKKWIVWGAVILIVVLIILRAIIRKIVMATRKPRVTGTLQYWPEGSPDEMESVDLTSFGKTQLALGSAPSNEIYLEGDDIDQIHIIFYAEKSGGEINIFLSPKGDVFQGYSRIIGDLKLENEMKFLVGKLECRYLSDSGY